MKIAHPLVIASLIASCLGSKLRKCCGRGEYLDIDLTCKQNQNENATRWIPEDTFTIISSQSVVKISKDLVAKTVQDIYENGFDVGFPHCDAFSRDLAISWREPDLKDEFYLLYENGKKNVLLNYFRKSVYHDNVTLSFKKSFLPRDFCVDSGPEDTYLAIVCPCSENICIRKCCHEEQIFDEDTKRCVSIDSMFDDDEINKYKDWRPEFAKSGFESLDTDVGNEYFLLSGVLPPCLEERGVYTELETDDRTFRYLEDGSIQVNSTNPTKIPSREHCGELSWNNSTRTLRSMVMRCFSKTIKEEIGSGTIRLPFYAPLLAFSALLLVASALVLFMEWNPDVEGKRGSKSILAHVCCLAVAHLIAVFSYSLAVGAATPACVISGYAMQFSFMAAFFWLNVMCLDMSWTFSGIRPPGGSQRDRDRRKFIFYSIYAWGGSMTLTIVALVVEYTPSVPDDSVFKPNMGVIKCWFAESGALWLYFYGPMAILLMMNVFLFIYTTYRIVVLKRGTNALHQENSARHGGGSSNRDRQKFILYAKLFSLMGITWLTEIISWAVGGPDYIWYFTDAINLLRAVFIFIIFCWKPRVWAVIKKKVPCAKKGEEVMSKLCCGTISANDTVEEMKTDSTSTRTTPSTQKGMELA